MRDDTYRDPRRPSHTLTPNDALEIVALLKRGELQSRIAARFDVNIGRISEVKNGWTFSHVTGIAPKPRVSDQQRNLFDGEGGE